MNSVLAVDVDVAHNAVTKSCSSISNQNRNSESSLSLLSTHPVPLCAPSSSPSALEALLTGSKLMGSMLNKIRGGGAISEARTVNGSGTCKGALVSTHAKGTVLTLSYFALWFALNVYYNIVNKRVLNALPLPFTVATAQLGIGAVYVSLSWLLRVRASPQISTTGFKDLLSIAFYHGSGQLFTVLSLGAAAVSFTHIVKALEPFFSALVAAVCFKQVFKPQVYLSLLPVVSGVAVACANDVSFGWLAFLTAMASNLAFALRANFSKGALSRYRKEGKSSMSPANVYGLVTILAFFLLLPLTCLWEGVDWRPSWRVATEKIEGTTLVHQLLLSGLFHYLNNEVMYLALDNVHPITLAVGNTAKRVFIIVASLLVFRNPITLTGAVGSGVGIAGVLIYSLTKQYYDTH